MIVEHSLGIWIIRISHVHFDLCLMENGEEEEERRRKKNNKIEIFTFDFLNCEKKSSDFGAIFYIRNS